MNQFTPSYLSRNASLFVHWDSFSDPESGIRDFTICISSSVLGVNPSYVQSNVKSQHLTIENLDGLVDGHLYYAIILVSCDAI